VYKSGYEDMDEKPTRGFVVLRDVYIYRVYKAAHDAIYQQIIIYINFIIMR